MHSLCKQYCKTTRFLTFPYQDRYFDYAECRSPYEVKSLLENVTVSTSPEIWTYYTLEETIVKKRSGGSSVRVNIVEDGSSKLEVCVSTNAHKRDCALVTDFPEQLVSELELEPGDLPELHPLLQVPISALRTLLRRKGITCEDDADDSDEIIQVDSVEEDLQAQEDHTSEENGNNAFKDLST